MRRFYLPEPYEMAQFETLIEQATRLQLLYEKTIERYKEQISSLSDGYTVEVMDLLDKINVLLEDIQSLENYKMNLDFYKMLLN